LTKFNSISSVPLGVIKPFIGEFEQLRERRTAEICNSADANGEIAGRARRAKICRLHGFPNSLGNDKCLVRKNTWKEHAKFLAAYATHKVHFAQRRSDALNDQLESLVAYVVTIIVVDVLK
jgi:hypothetical protein